MSLSPNAGVDIEPDGAGIAQNGTFTGCIFNNNKGDYALLIPGTGTTQNISFSNCIITASGSNSIEAHAKGISFTNCTISGGFSGGYTAANSTDATTFTTCNFDDNNTNSAVNVGPLVYLNASATKALFNGCNFTLRKTNSSFLSLEPTNSNVVSDYTTFRNCNFTYGSTYNYTIQPFSYFDRVIFDGNTNFTNNSMQSNGLRWSNVYITGNTTPCTPNTFTTSQNISWFFDPFQPVSEQQISFGYHPGSTANDLNLDVNSYGNIYIDGSDTNSSQFQQLNVGAATIFRNYSGSSLTLGWDRNYGTSNYKAIVNLFGRTIVDASATVRFNNSKINTTAPASGTGKFQVNRNALISNSFGSQFQTDLYLDGGNILIPANYRSPYDVLKYPGNPSSNILVNNGGQRLWNIANSSGDFSIQVGFETLTLNKNQVFYANNISIYSYFEVGIDSTNHPYIKFGKIGGTRITCIKAISPNINYLLTITRTSGLVAIYLDCTFMNSSVNSYGIDLPTVDIKFNPLAVGYMCSDNLGGSLFNGFFYLLRIWNRALAPSEIQTAYSNKGAYSDNGLDVDFEFRDGVTAKNGAAINSLTDEVSVPLDSCHQIRGSFTAGNTYQWSALSSSAFGTCPNPVPGLSYAQSTLIAVNNNLTIFPNPNNGQFSLLLPSEFVGPATTSIIDVTGNEIYREYYEAVGKIFRNVKKIILPGTVSKGVYILRITGANGVSSAKFNIN